MNTKTIFTLSIAILALNACSNSNVRSNLGLERNAPDEFAVLTRAPLEMPSSLALPPPSPGKQRPQEKTTISQAKEAVFGASDTEEAASSSENALLKKAGAHNTGDSIRSTINTETKILSERNKPVAEKLMNLGGSKVIPSATIVDAKKELERLQKNNREGKTVTDGKTPYIED